MKKKRIKVGKYNNVFKGILFDIEQAKAEMPDGKVKTFERVKRLGTVIVLAIDENGKLLMTREYRTRQEKVLWFLPTGRIEKGESSLKAAQRELREESGYSAKNIKLFHKYFNGSSLDWPMYAFIAKGLEWNPLPKDDGEEIEVVRMQISRAYKMVLEGKVKTETIAYAIMKLYAQTRKKH